jgi:hypothetical protein
MLRIVPAVCGVLLGVFASGCTESKEPLGQLMLAFDSDMAVPKDVNTARLRGDVGSYNTSTDFFVGPGENRLPATFGVLGKDQRPTNVRLTLSAGKDHPARTIGVAETTIPTNRIALLRLPIQWLCTLRGHGEEPDDAGNYTIFASDCAEDETCNAGRCEPAAIPEEDLPDYRPELVFGGGLGDDTSGTCFDTQQVFVGTRRRIIDDDLDLDTCRLELDTDAATVNFGLRVAGGDGVCIDSDLCLITLNLSERTGWFETDEDGVPIEGGGYAQLPTVICDELEKDSGARIIDVYQAIGSQTKVPAVPVCGPYSVPSCPANEQPCERQDGPDDPSCLEAGFDNDIDGEDIVDDPALASFIDLSHDLDRRTDALQAELGRACVAIAEGLAAAGVDVDDQWQDLGYTEDRPTLDSVGAACLSASAAGLTALAEAVRLKLGVMPAQCVVDTEAQTDCEEACAPDHGCDDDDRCATGATINSECSGACDEGSTCRAGEGAPTRCNGLCSGLCRGTCSGICTRSTALAGCEGFCEGTCEGFCEGDCELDVPLVCGTNRPGTCVGECDGDSEAQGCAEPLGGCEEIENDCAPICASGVAAATECPPAGLFLGRTPWTPQNAELENALIDAVLPELASVQEVASEAELILASAGLLDFDAIVSDAGELGERERECARRALDDESGRGVERSLDRLTTLSELAARLVNRDDEASLLGYQPPALPPVCEVLRANAEALDYQCFVCVADNCCLEYQRCSEDENCIDATTTMGEAPCMIKCVVDNSTAGEALDPQIVEDCQDQCEAEADEGLTDATIDLLECVSSNAGGSCETLCYATLSSEAP